MSCVTFLKPKVSQSLFLRTLVSCLDEVVCDIYAQHVGAELCRRQGRRAVATSKIKNLEPFGDSKGADKRLKSPFSQSALFGFI
jgi:hypothetical protein